MSQSRTLFELLAEDRTSSPTSGFFSIPIEERTLAHVFRQRVDASPDANFLWFPGRDTQTYREFDSDVRALAAAFRARGLLPGDRVALMLPNSPYALRIFLALWLNRLVAVPLNFELMGPLLTSLVRRIDPAVFIVDEAVVGSVDPELAEELGSRVLIAPQDIEPGAPDDEVSPVVEAADPAVILFTSGSTGPSKACVLTQHYCTYYGYAFTQGMGYTPDDVLYTCLPLHHVHALFTSFMASIMSGATLALAPKFSPSRVISDLAESGATSFPTLGSMAAFLLAQPSSPAEDRFRMRIAHCIPPPARIDDFEARFKAPVVSVLYGSTEALIFPPRRDLRSSGGLTGPEPEDWELAIVDEAMVPQPDNTVGELVGRPRLPGIMFEGYFGDPEATLNALRGLWWHTGDQFTRDEDGMYHYVGRGRDLLRRRGENISVHELEMLVGGHESVLEAAAFGTPSPLGEHDVTVVTYAGETPITADEISAFCEAKIPRFMRPDRVLVWPEPLPKNASGKVDKIILAELIADTSRDG
jgi:crotonobetaine/carnitine-CoA ligase